MNTKPSRHKPQPATTIPLPEKTTHYPEPFAQQVAGRKKRKLGDHFGLTHFGVNLTELAPGAVSALKHHHSHQDEFIYVLSGHPTLILGDDSYTLNPHDCYGFPANTGIAAQLINTTNEPAVLLEIGDRTPGDQVTYPDDDLQAVQQDDGQWKFLHKDGQPY